MSSDYPNGWSSISVVLPPVQAVRRFRWISVSGTTPTWALSNVYLGANCSGCSVQGYCNADGSCACNSGFQGPSCQSPVVSNSNVFRETFSNATLDSTLPVASGCSVQPGPVFGFPGNSLTCNGAGTRRVVTAALNTTNADFIEFLLYQAIRAVTSQVVLGYSVNGGALWSYLVSSASQGLTSVGSYSVPLPPGAKTSATMFMWWQPLFSGASSDTWVRITPFAPLTSTGSPQLVCWSAFASESNHYPVKL